ncbi:MAG: hypothetical protein EBZ77_08190 [Chitinophagia bacterium]|nr:hypothetical protein [Chitinophagia bacterium]
MKNFKVLASLLMFAVVSAFAATYLHEVHQVAYAHSVIAFVLFGFAAAAADVARNQVPKLTANDLTAGIDVLMWQREIVKRLFKDNTFLTKARDESQYVVGGAAVLIPQPGTAPTVVKNRNSFPATAVRRTDTVISYPLDEYTTDPAHMTKTELETVSYDKIQSIIADHFGYLPQTVADDILYKWANGVPSTALVATSGPDTQILKTNQTGSRKTFTFKELQEAARLMNNANVPTMDRVAIISADFLSQLQDSLSNTQYRDFSKAMDETTGIVGRLFGFEILVRSSVGMAADALDGSSNLQVNAIDAVTQATDKEIAICFQRDSVAKAIGNFDLFTRVGDPLYYGDVYSARLRAGGRVRRADSAGIVIVKQADGGNV